MSRTDQLDRVGRRPSRAVRALVIILVCALPLGWALVSCRGSGVPKASGTGRPRASATAEVAAPSALPVDIRPLLRPTTKYWGAALPGAPRSLAPVDEFTGLVGKRPSILEYYVAWGDGFDAARARNALSAGALPFLTWEPFSSSVADIAAGRSDAYITRFATQVRTANLPVAVSFGHEMNGDWYPWGTSTTSPADFVAAWRHVHDLFLRAGVGNVIWVWCANVINPVPKIALQPLYPGDAYVDWVGLVGYYTPTGAHAFQPLFGPTMQVIRRFTQHPFLITETAVEPGPGKPAQVADLIAGVRTHPDVLGFIWFDYRKKADWRLTTSPSGADEFRRGIAPEAFGVTVTAGR